MKDVSVVLAHGAWADGSSRARGRNGTEVGCREGIRGAASANLSC
jgi:hypothetical protein